jgi:hypothetical protein
MQRTDDTQVGIIRLEQQSQKACLRHGVDRDGFRPHQVFQHSDRCSYYLLRLHAFQFCHDRMDASEAVPIGQHLFLQRLLDTAGVFEYIQQVLVPLLLNVQLRTGKRQFLFALVNDKSDRQTEK